MIQVHHLGTNESYYFTANTPYEALRKMLYTLNLKHRDPDATINKTNSGLHLWLEHHGETYAVRN